MTYTKRNSGKYKPSWDRGNRWKQTKDEWQDFDKAVDETVDPSELAEMRCPASGSTIKVKCDHIAPGLLFVLHVQPKEYQPNTRPYGGKWNYRKPTSFGRELDGKTDYYIPLPGALAPHRGAWHEKKSWSQAVKTLLNEIIPAYENIRTQDDAV